MLDFVQLTAEQQAAIRFLNAPRGKRIQFEDARKEARYDEDKQLCLRLISGEQFSAETVDGRRLAKILARHLE